MDAITPFGLLLSWAGFRGQGDTSCACGRTAPMAAPQLVGRTMAGFVVRVARYGLGNACCTTGYRPFRAGLSRRLGMMRKAECLSDMPGQHSFVALRAVERSGVALDGSYPEDRGTSGTHVPGVGAVGSGSGVGESTACC